MAFTGVPLAVEEGGVAAFLFRQLIADQVRGSDGVMRDTDLRIKPRPAPIGEVLMGEGGVVVLNRSLGGTRQAYYDYNTQDEPIPIRGTGSSGGRSDLVIARVEDPNAAGNRYQFPADRLVGPYIFPRVIENVDKRVSRVQDIAQYANDSAVTLARIDQPANNVGITAAMIKDFRSIANGPQRYQEPDPPPDPPLPIPDENPWTESRIQPVSHQLTSTGWTDWPSSASWRVPIPWWANGVDVLMIVENPKQQVWDCTGESRVGIGNDWFGTPSPFDLPAISGDRSNRLPVFYSTTFRWGRNSGYPGSLRTFKFQARRTGSSTGRMTADIGTVTFAQLSFKVCPVID